MGLNGCLADADDARPVVRWIRPMTGSNSHPTAQRLGRTAILLCVETPRECLHGDADDARPAVLQ